MAITEAGKKVLWIAQFLAFLGFTLPDKLINLKADNRGAIQLTANPKFCCRTKHFKVRHQLIRKTVDTEETVITYISTNDMMADGLTKALDLKLLKAFRSMIGRINLVVTR